MLGFAYEVDSKLKEFWVNPNRTYQTIRTNRPKTIEILRQIAKSCVNDQRTNILYVAINTINNKLYVGITKKPLEIRKFEHFQRAKNEEGGLFQRAIRKYGEQAFDWIVWGKFSTYEKLLYYETRLIAEILPEYNMTGGGQGIVGLKITDEARKKLSESHKGKKYPNRKRPSKEVSEKIAARRRANGTYVAGKKPVLCRTNNKNFSSMKEAAIFYNIKFEHLSEHLQGKRALAGLEFEFVKK